MSKTITLTDEQYQALKNGEDITIKPPKKVWEPEGGKWVINSVNPEDVPSLSIPFVGWKESGCLRNSKEAAFAAGEEIRRYARLLDYRDQFAPWYVVPPPGEDAFTVFIDNNGEYVLTLHKSIRVLCAVYMPKEVGQDLVRKLKSGEVVL